MNSFISWIGGKSQLRREILAHFPSSNFSRYIEVFGGAGWILFSKERHADLEVFNDIDGHLINLYRCVQYHCAELQRELRLGGNQVLPNSREMFLDYLQQLNMRGLTDIQRAARYYYLIRASYGADHKTFGCNSKLLEKSIDRLPEIQQRLQKVVIENRDFESLIKTYDRPDALLYLDPPYYQAEKYYDGFSEKDHLRLRACLETIKGKFVLSYNDCPEVSQWYKNYTIERTDRANNLQKHNKSRYKELIISNF